MITWEEHGRERIRTRRSTAAVSSVPTPTAAPSSVEVMTGVKRPHEGDQGTSGVGSGMGDVMSGVAAEQQAREKVLKTEAGSASVAAAAAVATCGGVEGMTDSFTLNRSSVRESPSGCSSTWGRCEGSWFRLFVDGFCVFSFKPIFPCVLKYTNNFIGITYCSIMTKKWIFLLFGRAGLEEQQQVETVVNFVVRVALFAMSSVKDNSIGHLTRQCLGLLERALDLWPDTAIKYTYVFGLRTT